MTHDGHRLLARARTALEAGWGIERAKLRLVRNAWNQILDVRAGSRRFALRLASRHYHSVAGLRSELAWLERLKELCLLAPVPHRTMGDHLLELPDDPDPHAAVLFDWVVGRRPAALSEQTLRQLGAIAARLHDHADTGHDGDHRPRWNSSRLRRWWFEPHDERGWEGLGAEAADTFSQCFDSLADVDARLERAHPELFGLIHADLHRKNLLHTPQGLAVIDFDDCGVGCRLYELAVPLANLEVGAGSDEARARGRPPVRSLAP